MGDVTFTAQTRFHNNLRLELNQHESKLASRSLKRNESGADKIKLDNLIANSKTMKKTTRHAPVTYVGTGHDGIWIAKPFADFWADLVDNDDKLVTGVDIQGGYVMAAASAINRAEDDAWIAGFYGDMITGKSGTVLNAFPAANIVAVDVRDSGSGATGMNVAKIRAARKIMAQNFVDMSQQFYLGLTAEQVDDLFAETQVLSSDFQRSLGVRVSADGKSLIGLHGFEFVEVELGNPLLANTALTKTGSYRKNPFWVRDAVVMNYWETLFTSVDRLPTQHFEAQVYARVTVGASRTDQARAGYILSAE